ncbi:hypothetical protein V6N12_003168 [Hibiscus sabdariffa]|uniref:Uncharacterized protein n=1 Tax=Hibiscus sabdariffa TaxID=183260 RepID=A0ABR2EB50_9ROSI
MIAGSVGQDWKMGGSSVAADHVAIRGLHLSRPFQGNPSHVTHLMALVAWQRGLPTLVRPPSTRLLHQTSRPLTA